MPLLLHPEPESALVICFGTGNTLGACSLWPLETIDGVELSTEVVKASFIFKETNHDVANDPGVRMIIEDGRNYVLGTDRRYDVITEEPPLVHTAGVVNLYSKDFYELCRQKLTDNGIMAVWLATWEFEAKMLARSFVEAFPHASIWDSMHPGEWILIGSKKPLARHREVRAARRMSRDYAALAQDFLEIGRTREAFETLESALEKIPEPANADIFAMTAALYARLGQRERARKALEKAVAIDPESPITRQVLRQFNRPGS
ncbi:MAG: tetratricopeptide repeat protein [Candidatus Eisenbacteria bacterium]|nr:tetratricopeptide repeat protein [Candidatus Eisenbacteria bacterium]